MFSVITNIYNKKSNFLQPQENWKKFFFLQLEMFDVCTRGDTAHIDTIFKLLPHTRQLPHHRIVHKLLEQHPSQRTHSLHRRTPDLQPTTTSDNTPHCCKPQSYAPEDGQKIARNMLSWFKDQ